MASEIDYRAANFEFKAFGSIGKGRCRFKFPVNKSLIG